MLPNDSMRVMLKQESLAINYECHLYLPRNGKEHTETQTKQVDFNARFSHSHSSWVGAVITIAFHDVPRKYEPNNNKN